MALLRVLILCLCILCCHKADARNHTQQERIQRSEELENILVSTEDEFDCVDIYKQSSLQHPLLKNHKIQLEPSFARETNRKDSNPDNLKGCPPGKVPIYRYKMKDQMNFSSMESGIGKFPEYLEAFPRRHFATLDTIPPHPTTYHGAAANINICAPSVKKGQYSLAQIYAQSGPPGQLNTVQGGWGDITTGHWWLTVEDNKKSTNIGYWPKQLFTHLSNGASMMRYGGQVGAALGMPSPPMGTGKFAEAKYLNACFFSELQVVDSKFKFQVAQSDDMKIYSDTPKCFDLLYPGDEGPGFGQVFLYGGPGGRCVA
ncbi:hypothetical protein Fmac_017598 [Flemingia macrophylla]|uniref:Neprosin PEP catalytic domain-containing protein n=1 Tax=Flemingia macrophylla TaxID=520843 RepID=A0ABD1M318_9FABA